MDYIQTKGISSDKNSESIVINLSLFPVFEHNHNVTIQITHFDLTLGTYKVFTHFSKILKLRLQSCVTISSRKSKFFNLTMLLTSDRIFEECNIGIYYNIEISR